MVSITRGALLSWAAAGLAVAACGGAAVAAAALAPAPSDLRTATPIRSIPVGHAEFDDGRAVTLAVRSSTEYALSAPATGRITAFDCAEGAEVASGTSPLAIDDGPRLALATATPPWRDLAPRTRGADVRALQDELDRLGFSVASDGVVGPRTIAAFADALENVGGVPDRSMIRLDSLIWLPSAHASIADCTAAAGQDVQPGMPLATFTGVPPSASVLDLPTNLVPGERVLVVGPDRIPVDEEGTVHDPAILVALGRTAAGRTEGATAPQPIDAHLVLSAPLAVAVVPPSAVYGVSGEEGCVTTDGTTRRVRIHGSQLGQTMVTFADGPPPEAVDVRPPRTACG
ncbi:peptidoglycan-binding domain-containing protein [Leifsonia naganoensis]|uniref:Peptidoglycan hydrolase-like protein with peptidoglycan-binding domain n=1 Tax=Leifsonia naganoensis TaxID=150025 RepID=A0A853DVR3_9MICO|nr:peptidoglycan-binding domain-containing protein [Leifsonia naganoensis]NYK10731.1 peptidoglycan hydrolase-like protein with peptidoglycan-binding domain [Leifsonia naganoensis]